MICSLYERNKKKMCWNERQFSLHSPSKIASMPFIGMVARWGEKARHLG